MQTKILLAGLAATALLAGHASATPLLYDNFDSAPLQLNWPGDSVFVSNGGVDLTSTDLIGDPNFYDFLPGNGRYVDLDGSTGSGNDPAGVLTSIASFGPGRYRLSFSLAGNQRISTLQTTTASLGDFSADLTPGQFDPFQTFTYTFDTATAGSLVFTEHGPSNQQGNLLDNVNLTAVPEPATWAMMLLGFAGLGATLRARRGKLALA